MKQVLKPLGHCLTTAVMTSAMLRVYALPTVEAAVPNPAQAQPSSNEMAPAVENKLDSSSDAVSPAQFVSTPEVVSPIETTPAHPLPDKAESNHTSGSIAPEPAARKPESPTSATLNPSEPKNSPTSTQKVPASPAPTVAGMRQTVEKRLATIVEQDKISRDEQWRQNLMVSAIQAAWNGEFEQARKIATHPALPAVLQAELLGKIAAVETQLKPSQVAQQPNGKKLSPQQGNPQINSQLANQSSRQIPSGQLSSIFPSLAGYPGFGQQCPAIGTTQPHAQPADSTSLTSQGMVSRTDKSGIPVFVPHLSENLAAQLVQFSQSQAGTNPKKPIDLKQVFAAPQLFVGVAAKSVLAKPIAHSTAAKDNLVVATTPSSSLDITDRSIDTTAKASLTSTDAEAIAVTPNPVTHNSSTAPSSTALSARQSRGLSRSSTPKTDRLLASIEHLPLDQLVASSPAQQSKPPLGHPVEFAVSLVQFIPGPIQQMWHWWNPEAAPWIEQDLNLNQPVGLQSLPLLEQSTTWVSSAKENLAITAQTGLGDSLWQSWNLELPPVTPVAPLRSGHKFSNLYFPTTKTTTEKLTQPVVLDANALIAASCASAQLTNQFNSTVIDPATSQRHGWVNLMFPLPIPAVVTSVFGWRTHPISGNLSFHTGLDLGAPMGTPVLAALEGQVIAADAMGGYGLAVVVENSKTRQRNLYGHLSGIAVEPGTPVTRGTVLGWVGSTGNSTGPHLHFESMIHTENGWTAIDPLAIAALASSHTE